MDRMDRNGSTPSARVRRPLSGDFAEGGVVTCHDGHDPEPPIEPGEIAPSWNRCTIPGCRHDPCPAKLRAWTWYGRRYICEVEGCAHADCAPKRRAEEDGQPFGVFYDGPVLPQHKVDRHGRPLGPPMHAVKGTDGEWRLFPRSD